MRWADPQEDHETEDPEAYWDRWDAVIESRGLEDEPWAPFNPDTQQGEDDA